MASRGMGYNGDWIKEKGQERKKAKYGDPEEQLIANRTKPLMQLNYKAGRSNKRRREDAGKNRLEMNMTVGDDHIENMDIYRNYKTLDYDPAAKRTAKAINTAVKRTQAGRGTDDQMYSRYQSWRASKKK